MTRESHTGDNCPHDDRGNDTPKSNRHTEEAEEPPKVDGLARRLELEFGTVVYYGDGPEERLWIDTPEYEFGVGDMR